MRESLFNLCLCIIDRGGSCVLCCAIISIAMSESALSPGYISGHPHYKITQPIPHTLMCTFEKKKNSAVKHAVVGFSIRMLL